LFIADSAGKDSSEHQLKEMIPEKGDLDKPFLSAFNVLKKRVKIET